MEVVLQLWSLKRAFVLDKILTIKRIKYQVNCLGTEEVSYMVF